MINMFFKEESKRVLCMQGQLIVHSRFTLYQRGGKKGEESEHFEKKLEQKFELRVILLRFHVFPWKSNHSVMCSSVLPFNEKPKTFSYYNRNSNVCFAELNFFFLRKVGKFTEP